MIDRRTTFAIVCIKTMEVLYPDRIILGSRYIPSTYLNNIIISHTRTHKLRDKGIADYIIKSVNTFRGRTIDFQTICSDKYYKLQCPPRS